jgi:polyphosphate kinase 2
VERFDPETIIDHLDDSDRDYLYEVSCLQVELLQLQMHIRATGQRLLILFEGRDTAGKGGAIIRFTQHLNHRHHRVVALPKPTEAESGQWYFQRYLEHLPDPGEIAFFDRSWYNRAVVEPVMGFCTPEQHEAFLEQVNVVEKLLVDDGIHLIKFWFSIDLDEQLKRVLGRKNNPLKRWKLSPVDQAAAARWEEFTRYKNKMFERTSTEYCPWWVVRGNVKKIARLESIRFVLDRFDYPDKGITGQRVTPDPTIVTHMRPVGSS